MGVIVELRVAVDDGVVSDVVNTVEVDSVTSPAVVLEALIVVELLVSGVVLAVSE